jgi:hypothetical protein
MSTVFRWAAASLLLLAFASTALAQDDELNGPSPAEEQARVMAQSVAELPDEEVAWRVTEEEAPLADDASFDDQPLGFIYARSDAILIIDEQTGSQIRIAGGEAAFLPADSSRELVSLGDEEAAFIRIALVPAGDAGDEPDGATLVFASDPFDAPEGLRDIDLVGSTLEMGSIRIPSPSAPTLIYAVRGDLAVRLDDKNTDVNSRKAASLGPGTPQVTDGGDIEASFLAAVIGPEIPALDQAEPTREPTATPQGTGGDDDTEAASVSVTVTRCPDGHTFPDQLDGPDPDCVDPIPDLYLSLTANDTGEILEDFTDDNGNGFFGDLGAGSYSLSAALDGAIDARIVCGSAESGLMGNGDPMQIGAGEAVDCSVNFIVAGGGNNTEGVQGTGEIFVTAISCPVDYAGPSGPAGVDPSCDGPMGDVYVYLEQLDGDGSTVDGTTGGDGVLDFTDLPAGTWAVSASPNSIASANVWIACTGPNGDSGDIAVLDPDTRVDCFVHVSEIPSE